MTNKQMGEALRRHLTLGEYTAMIRSIENSLAKCRMLGKTQKAAELEGLLLKLGQEPWQLAPSYVGIYIP